MKCDACIKPFILSFLMLYALLGGPASAAELREIRTGKYNGFARIVFQFETPVRYRVKSEEKAGELSLTFMDSTSSLTKDRLSKISTPVESIDFHQTDRHLVVAVVLSFPLHSLKAFTLYEPDRVVFDLYPVTDLKSEVMLNKIVIKESIKAEPVQNKSAASVSHQNIVQPNQAANASTASRPVENKPAEKTASEVRTGQDTAQSPDPLPQKMESTQVPEVAAVVRPGAEPGNFQNYLMIVLAGISMIILVLVGVLLLQKKSSADKSQYAEARQELKTTADIMTSIDARIKEKFQQYEES